MKTSHAFARELLALPDLPIFHFDPTFAGVDDEADFSLTNPVADINKPEPGERFDPFITISADHQDEEPADFLNRVLDLLVAGGHVTKEKVAEARSLALTK